MLRTQCATVGFLPTEGQQLASRPPPRREVRSCLSLHHCSSCRYLSSTLRAPFAPRSIRARTLGHTYTTAPPTLCPTFPHAPHVLVGHSSVHTAYAACTPTSCVPSSSALCARNVLKRWCDRLCIWRAVFFAIFRLFPSRTFRAICHMRNSGSRMVSNSMHGVDFVLARPKIYGSIRQLFTFLLYGIGGKSKPLAFYHTPPNCTSDRRLRPLANQSTQYRKHVRQVCVHQQNRGAASARRRVSSGVLECAGRR